MRNAPDGCFGRAVSTELPQGPAYCALGRMEPAQISVIGITRPEERLGARRPRFPEPARRADSTARPPFDGIDLCRAPLKAAPH